jgi:DNA-binding LacI/PurR family transcriptional regulator
VFAYNDAAALAAMRVCQQRGLRVPEDIAIIGFDDIALAAHAGPSLSTIAVDKEALGRRGVELLLEESPAVSEISLPVRLVARASTGHDASHGANRDASTNALGAQMAQPAEQATLKSS